MTTRKRTTPRKPVPPVSAPPVADRAHWSDEEPLIFRQLVEERGGFPTPPKLDEGGGNS